MSIKSILAVLAVAAALLLAVISLPLWGGPGWGSWGSSSDTETLALNDSLSYHGQTTRHRPDGIGVLYIGDSIVYSGHWKDGLRQGTGTTRDAKGRLVSASFDHDTIVSGTFRDSTGVYTGGLDSLCRAHGYGSYRDTLGTYFEGLWQHGERTGFGFSSQHSNFRAGEWKHDKYKGERLNYTAERIYGIDISKYQHIDQTAQKTTKKKTKRGKKLRARRQKQKTYAIDWKNLRITHLGSLSKKNISGDVDFRVSFVFIKATEGQSLTNPYYAADYRAARANGYHVGSYHFFSHLSSGSAQASHFLAHSRTQKGDLPPVLDLEPLPSQIKKMGGVGAMWSRVRTWLKTVEQRTGMRPILYISQTFVNRYLDYAPDIKRDYTVWIARYGEYKPDVKLRFWQLAPDGRVRGIHGHTDINVFNGYNTEFQQWLNSIRN